MRSSAIGSNFLPVGGDDGYVTAGRSRHGRFREVDRCVGARRLVGRFISRRVRVDQIAADR